MAETVEVLRTARLVLRRMTALDAPFMLELLNDPGFVRFVADRGVRTEPEAAAYLERAIMRGYAEHGFGLYAVARQDDGCLTGICGLVRRPGLDGVDIGFAFLPAYRGLGYASEAAAAVVGHARWDHGIRRLLAITSPDNALSIRVLEKLGFTFQGLTRLTPGSGEVKLFRLDLA